jgi:hypothetical protein
MYQGSLTNLLTGESIALEYDSIDMTRRERIHDVVELTIYHVKLTPHLYEFLQDEGHPCMFKAGENTWIGVLQLTAFSPNAEIFTTKSGRLRKTICIDLNIMSSLEMAEFLDWATTIKVRRRRK